MNTHIEDKKLEALAKDIKSEEDLSAPFRCFVKLTVETVLNAEMAGTLATAVMDLHSKP